MLGVDANEDGITTNFPTGNFQFMRHEKTSTYIVQNERAIVVGTVSTDIPSLR